MDDTTKGSDDKNGRLLTFPGGKKLDPSDIGVDFIVSQVGTIPTPELQDPSDIEREIRVRENFVNNQQLVQAIEQRSSTSEMIDILLKEIAEETSHLKYERNKAVENGKSTANFNVARIASLRNLAEILLKRKEADLAEKLDLKSPRIQKMFQIWMEFFYNSMEKSGVESEVIDLVFKQMKADMKDWELKMHASG